MIEELRDHIIVDTAHSYKGLECDSVVILDAVANHYPLIHPHWIFGQIFGDTLEYIEAAELRLFYVAVSRAKDRLIICTQDSKRSPFLDTIRSARDVPTLDLNKLPSVVRKDSHRYEVRVLNSYEVRKLLKDDGFTFVPESDSRLPYWSKVIPAEEVSADWIDKALWNDGNVIIEVYDQTNKRIWSSTDGGDASALAPADPF
ncbi:3'-5' exonuclease [Candidatus Poriferisodalis sp.]|uniref:3'-5' exonuclease n=1 Tax=Candidatus Poriferisodalis sp. TaxID=3101277 RepID=UPI003B5B4D62